MEAFNYRCLQTEGMVHPTVDKGREGHINVAAFALNTRHY